uniref:Centromere protein L n=1 Tax=Sphaeramia orbicularis TaxID=375764 RepID=A0A673BM01_9TELE
MIISVVKTPRNSDGAQRSSYRQSYRSYVGAVSRLGLTSALTARRLNTSRRAPRAHNITDKVSPEHLAVLVKKEWQLSYVTPLFQFRHTQLKRYSQQLSAFIAAERQGVAVEVEEPQHSFKASFSVVHGMAEAEEDAETILIQVHSKHHFSRRDDPEKCVWSGWLACINGSPEYIRSLPKDFICLPLFGSSGGDPLTSSVKSWFQQTFDCCFGSLEINHTSLQWLGSLWTNCQPESNIQHLKMIWAVPVVPPLQITYTVNPQDAWELWTCVRKDAQVEKEGEEEEEEEEEGIIDIEEVNMFMQELKSHFYRHFKLDLSAGNLVQVSTALGSAKTSGRIKISNSRYMISTLTLLTECALLKMPV